MVPIKSFLTEYIMFHLNIMDVKWTVTLFYFIINIYVEVT